MGHRCGIVPDRQVFLKISSDKGSQSLQGITAASDYFAPLYRLPSKVLSQARPQIALQVMRLPSS